MRLLLFPIFISLFYCVNAQEIPSVEVLTSGTKSSLRGLSVVNNEVVWVCGSNGTVGRSANGGKDWKWFVIKGFEKKDFRDIEAFDFTTAVVMCVGEPGYILKTSDAGATWKVVYENKTKGIFLDAMEFWNIQAGIVIGDPINGKFFIARSFDGGSSWKEVPSQYLPGAVTGEACFAASGTNIRALDNDEAVFVSGGTTSNVYIRDTKIHVPIIQGKETTGANSIAVWDRFRKNGGNQLVIVGGDFNADTSALNNCYYSTNRGKSWTAPEVPPHGYRSCVEYLAKKILVTCGPTGVDYSTDNATTWKQISTEGFFVVRIAKVGNAVFLAGPNGKIGKLMYTGKKK